VRAGSGASSHLPFLAYSFRFLYVAQDVSSHPLGFLFVCFLCLPLSAIMDSKPFRARSANKPFLLYNVLVVMFYHNNRKITHSHALTGKQIAMRLNMM